MASISLSDQVFAMRCDILLFPILALKTSLTCERVQFSVGISGLSVGDVEFVAIEAHEPTAANHSCGGSNAFSYPFLKFNSRSLFSPSLFSHLLKMSFYYPFIPLA